MTWRNKVMSEELKNNEAVMSDTSTVQKKIESVVFSTLKNKIRGHIYAKMEEKTNENDIDTLYININSNGIIYTEQLKLPGDTFEMVSQSDSYAETLALMVFDNFKKYIDGKFYVQDKPRRYNKKR